MANVSLVFNGLEELREALRNLPAELTAEAARIVEAEANYAAVEMKRGYPVGKTSNLNAGVTLTHVHQGKWSAGILLKNRAKHAYIYEYGTEARHYYESSGKRHLTGRMPAGNVFVPAMQRARRRMWAKFEDLLRRHGLIVSRAA